MNSDDAISTTQDTRELTFRNSIARWLVVVSLGLLMCGYLAIAGAWIYAFQTERIPNVADAAQYSRTGHGPWDHVSDLAQIVEHGMAAPFFAMIPALASMLVRRRTFTAVLIGVCIISWLALMYTHFWLID